MITYVVSYQTPLYIIVLALSSCDISTADSQNDYRYQKYFGVNIFSVLKKKKTRASELQIMSDKISFLKVFQSKVCC